MKKYIFAGVAVAVLATSVLLISQRATSPELASWQEYTDPASGVTIQHPSDFDIKASGSVADNLIRVYLGNKVLNNSSTQFTKIDGTRIDGECGIEIAISNRAKDKDDETSMLAPNPISFEESARSGYGGKTMQAMMINGVTSYKFSYKENYPGYLLPYSSNGSMLIRRIDSYPVGGAPVSFQKNGADAEKACVEIFEAAVKTGAIGIGQNPAETKVTILVPKDIDSYAREINKCGGEQKCAIDAAKKLEFVKKEITVPYTSDVIKASALAAANFIQTQGGVLTIIYWKIQDTTAYVVLNIDEDGWAGVSFSLSHIRPIIEKTLLQFPQIKNVVFGYAPGDK